MADEDIIIRGIFRGKLLLSKAPITEKTSISNENYTFDEPDPHLKNVFHGRMFNCPSEKVFTTSSVSCMLFSKCVEAFEMKTHLETLDEAVGIAGSGVKTYGVVHLKPKVASLSVSGSKPKVASLSVSGSVLKPRLELKSKAPPMQFGSFPPETSSPNTPETSPSNAPNDVIILVTGRISTTTFDDWLKAQTRHEDALILFKDLFYIVKKIHSKNMYCGNVRDGIRISGNKPMLVYPARSGVMELDEGIWSDLREVRKMVSESMLNTTSEWILFNELCEEYAPNVNSVSELNYRGAQLREGSFLILSSSIIWNSAQRYDFVRKLGEYRSLDIHRYDFLVSDYSGYGNAIPNINWYARLKNAAPGTDEYSLNAVYTHNAKGNYAFGTSESIRYLERCAYEHLKRKHIDYTEVSDILYKIFPEAPSALYRMMVDILYRQTRSKNPMPSVIDFFWKEPHCFN